MAEYGFETEKDFCSKMSESTGGRPVADYEISVDVMRHIYLIGGTGAVRRSQNWLSSKNKFANKIVWQNKKDAGNFSLGWN